MTNKLIQELNEYYSKPSKMVINDYRDRIIAKEVKNRFYVYLKSREDSISEGFEMNIEASDYLEAFEKFLNVYKYGI